MCNDDGGGDDDDNNNSVVVVVGGVGIGCFVVVVVSILLCLVPCLSRLTCTSSPVINTSYQQEYTKMIAFTS